VQMMNVGENMPKKYNANPPRLAKRAMKIYEDRAGSLGNYKPLYEEIAARWSLVLRKPVTPAEVARMLIEMKLARWNAGYAEDHALDAANYSFIAGALDVEKD